jgi:uncharacterized protein YyaL (SSP411 family)
MKGNWELLTTRGSICQMNRLGNETSLYLRQHADNPVDWHPWDDEALDLARRQRRPILLSIGYSACHWCHVMAHESFENERTAEVMNRLFVNVKVDREERPDLDRIYQLAHQLMTGRGGGWPLTVFLEPADLIPFFAGTYFPPERRHGMPSFTEVLLTLDRWYRENQDEVRDQNGRVSAALKAIHNPAAGGQQDSDSESALLRAAAAQALSRFDAVHGGYGGAPKFPQAPLLSAVASLAGGEPGGGLDRGLEFSLEKMAASGLRDHLDGGFFRYCVDDSWTIPHFEKMLYDNAMLMPLYAEGAARWSHAALESAACGIADWLDSVMKQESGGYAASIDADAGGEEGGFHVWQRTEVEDLLDKPSFELFQRRYGLDGPPNFEGRAWHLQERLPLPDLARERGLAERELKEQLEAARDVLLAARAGRVHPELDDKRLTSWNALLAEGWVRAGRALGREDWLDNARGIFEFIEKRLWADEGLQAVFNRGQARLAAYLDDYAWLLNALTLYLQSRWDRGLLDFAVRLAEQMLLRFEDREGGGFFFSDAGVDVPITRAMIFQDDATPAGNAIAVSALNRLGHLLGEPRFTSAADRCLGRALPLAADSPLAYGSLIATLGDLSPPRSQIVIAGHNEDAMAELQRQAAGRDRVDCYLIGPPDDTLPGILREFRTPEPATAWLCRGLQCLPPVHSAQALEALLEAKADQDNPEGTEQE